MKAEFFLVTYAKDYDFTTYTLRSIAKFASGFSGITIVVPYGDLKRFEPLAKKHDCNLRGYFESESKGFLHHQVCKCEADLWCPKGTDLIVHIDSDCVFKEPFSLNDFMGPTGKPILVRERFDDFRHNTYRYSWRQCVEHALGIDMPWETMVRHPGVFWAGMYRAMRDHIETRHRFPFTQYVLLQRNEFPQTFAEFPTLGGFALGCWGGSAHYDITTRLRTPSEYWRERGIEPVPRGADGKPEREMDMYLWEDGSRATILDPVHYFWSRAGVTAEIRGRIEQILGR